MNKEKVINKLNHLLNRSYDAEKGYTEAANHISSASLNRWLQENGLQRYRFGHELKSEIKNLGGTPNKGTTFMGEMHKLWMDFKSNFTYNDEAAMLNEAIRGEKTALEDYESTISETSLPLETKILLEDQRDSIKSNIRTMKRMLKIYSAVTTE
jgi:uncharacterized protein (TIGR02284 family)